MPPDPAQYPGALPHMLYAGSLVFVPPRRVTGLRDWSQWWTFMKGADWRHPYGPKSNINVQDNHPVVHIAMMMPWPTPDGPARICRPRPNGNSPRRRARRRGVRVGRRPHAWWRPWPTSGRAISRSRIHEDGFERTSPVTAFAPNGYGVYNMIGNAGNGRPTGGRKARSRCAEGVLYPSQSARRSRSGQP